MFPDPCWTQIPCSPHLIHLLLYKMLIDFRQQPTKCGLYGSALPLIQSQEQRESVGKGT